MKVLVITSVIVTTQSLARNNLMIRNRKSHTIATRQISSFSFRLLRSFPNDPSFKSLSRSSCSGSYFRQFSGQYSCKSLSSVGPSSRSFSFHTRIHQSSSPSNEDHHVSPNTNRNRNILTKLIESLTRLLTNLKSQDLSVPTILLSAFLNLLGFTMASPLQPALGRHFSLPIGASFGSLSSAYPLGMMGGVFLWPTLSDVLERRERRMGKQGNGGKGGRSGRGRKIVMTLTLLGSGMGLWLQSWGIERYWSLEQFLIARVLTGCFAGNGAVSKAYLADRGSHEDERDGDGEDGKKGAKERSKGRSELTKYLAWRDAASTLAFIAGPVLGGLLYQDVAGTVVPVTGVDDNTKRISFVIRFSAVASLVASLVVALFVTPHDGQGRRLASDSGSSSETSEKLDNNTLNSEEDSSIPNNDNNNNKNDEIHKPNNGKQTSKNSNNNIISCPLGTKLWTGVLTVALISALYHAADSTFFAFFPSLLQSRLRFDAQRVGLAFTTFAFISFGMSAFVSSKVIRVWGPVASCVMGLGAVGSALWTLGCAASSNVVGTPSALTAAFILGSAALYYLGVPLYGPTIPTMLLQCVPPHQRGVVMGFDGTINTMARVISPLAMGEIHRLRGAGACFKVAGMCVYVGVLLALGRRWVVLRKQFGRGGEKESKESAGD